MFDNFHKEKKNLWYLLVQVGLFFLIVALASFLVGFGIYGITYFWDQLSTKQKREYAELLRRQQQFQEKLNITVLRAGYLARQRNSEITYVPTLQLEITNTSQEALEALMISVYFKIDKKTFCRSHLPITSLQPAQIMTLVANCIEWVGFGSVYKGLPLIKTSQLLNYEVWVSYQRIYTKFTEGSFSFQLLE
mgnify:CR=1 FL=1